MYHALSEIWASGLVLENYMGIIDLICSPLQPNIASRPLTFADISSTLDEGGNNSADDPSSSSITNMAKTFSTRTSKTLMVDDMDEEVGIDEESFARQRLLRRRSSVNFNESSYIMDTNLNC